MGTLEEIKQVNEKLANDQDVQEVSVKLDIAEQIHLFTTTPAGKIILDELKKDCAKLIEQLITATKKPETANIVSLCSQLNAQIGVLAKFTHTANKAQQAQDLLHSLLELKNNR